MIAGRTGRVGPGSSRGRWRSVLLGRRERLHPGARDVHSLCGLFFSLALMFMFATGTLTVFSPEIDWLLHPPMRVAPGPAKAGLGDVLAVAVAARPGWHVDRIERATGPRVADAVFLTSPAGRARALWVDPYRLEPRGETAARTFRTVLRDLHATASSSARLAALAVAALSLPLAAMTVSGFLQYRGGWRGLVTPPRLGGRRRAALSGLHRFLGAWSLAVLVPVALTSAVFLVEILGVAPPPLPPPRIEVGTAAAPSPDELRRAEELARSAFPGMTVTAVTMPMRPRDPLTLAGPWEAALVRPTANVVHVDAAGGTLVGARRAEDLGLHWRIFEATRIVHFGQWGGLASRILWLVAGLAGTALAVLGAMIFGERMAARAGPGASRLRAWWTGMGAGKWLSLGLLGFAAAMTVARMR